jgi:FdhD protein
MTGNAPLGMATPFEVLRYENGKLEATTALVATEVPLTLQINGTEIATLACSPCDLREFGYGFLFTAGFIQRTDEVVSLTIDNRRWLLEGTLNNPPDPAMLTKRLFTSGCGRGVMFSNLTEISLRRLPGNDLRIAAEAVPRLARLLQCSSPSGKASGGIHTAALSLDGATFAYCFDDIGRHNAVDKVIGAALIAGSSFASGILLVTGRISSEILFKARRAQIPVIVSLGSATHQTVLLAREIGLTVAGYARGAFFTVYAHPERLLTPDG